MNKNKITRFSEMNLNKETSKIGSHNESLSSVGSKIKRVVTGKSAGEEIQKLSQSQQDRLTELYRENPEDAAANYFTPWKKEYDWDSGKYKAIEVTNYRKEVFVNWIMQDKTGELRDPNS
jgi:hypothetical protein